MGLSSMDLQSFPDGFVEIKLSSFHDVHYTSLVSDSERVASGESQM